MSLHTLALSMISATNLTTNPLEHVGFVSASPVRGTIQLVWSCVFTIILCTWNIQRPVVPSPKESTWQRTFRPLCLVFVTIAAPEALATLALMEHLSARFNKRLMRQSGFPNWTMKHAFFADMGGYLLEYNFEKCMLVTSKEIQWLARKRLLNPAELRSSDIDDLSREDIYKRMILTLQLVWFFLQCTGRAIEGLDISLFEVTTLSFVTYALGILILWWQKPTGVSARVRLHYPAVTDNIVKNMLDSTKNDRHQLVAHLRTGTLQEYDFGHDAIDLTFRIIPLVAFTSFGAWHVAAWNYSFPTKVECILWRVSSIGAVVLQITTMLVLAVDLSEEMSDLEDYILYSIACLYLVMRTYIVIETIISLRSAPAGIYQQVGWSSFVPHI